MHPVLQVVRAASFVVLSAVWQDRLAELVATKVVQKVGISQVGNETKEGIMAGISSADVSLSHLNPIPCDYHHKAIHTEAIQVTLENIGKLSLEFEEELFYGPDGRPFFVFDAQRGENVDGGEVTQLYVRVTDWIVPLRGEIHIYREQTFWTTFDLPTAVSEDDFAPRGRGALESLADYAKRDAELTAETFGTQKGMTLPPIQYVGETETFPNTGVFDEGQHRAE